MKKLLVFLIIYTFTITLYGCTTEVERVYQEPNQAVTNTREFIELEPSIWIEFIKPVREYMYYKKSAVIAGDINLLWDRYPLLKNGSDPSKGINVEKQYVDLIKNYEKIIDGNVTIEGYNRIKIKKLDEDHAEILVHGSEVYLSKGFETTGGEILIILHVERNNGYWDVIKTDEFTLAEYKEWINNKEMK